MTTSDATNQEGAAGRGAEGTAKPEPQAAATTSAGEPQAAGASALSFEESTRRLAKIVSELEGGDLPLERALALFEEGIRLSRTAQERLDRAEKRVEELLGIDADGRPITREFEG
jgi:exodeoxyribonuclease VII small subunit